MSAEPVLLDTNVLIYAFTEKATHHQAARALLDQAKEESANLVVVPQVVSEFYAVATNPRQMVEARKPHEVLEVIRILLELPGLTLLPTPPDVVTRWLELVNQRPVTGQKIFDVQLVATMLGNDVHRIYTFNTADFEAFEEIDTLKPGE